MYQFSKLFLISFLFLLSTQTIFAGRYYDSRTGRFLQVDPKANKYPSLSPYSYCANNPLKFIDPDGKEIKNAKKYVLSNQSLVKAAIAFNNELAKISGKSTGEFIMNVTGGDRFKDKIGEKEVHRSSTNNEIVNKSDKNSPHLVENGARGIDLSLPKGISNEQIQKAAKATGFSQVLITNYNDGHFHLTLDRKNSSSDLVKNNTPTFEETKPSTNTSIEKENNDSSTANEKDSAKN